jgi:hypothetical protein
MITAPYKRPVMIGRISYPSLPCWLAWKIHIVEVTERVVDKGNNYEDDMIRAMEGMQT